MNSMIAGVLFVFAALVSLAAFVGIWCLVLRFVSWIGGWSALAARYATDRRRMGRTFRMQSGKVGLASYGGCLNIGIGAEGLHLSVLFIFRCGHPPLLIPWEDLKDPRPMGMLFWRSVEVSVGTPAVAKVRLPRRVFDAAGELQQGEPGEGRPAT